MFKSNKAIMPKKQRNLVKSIVTFVMFQIVFSLLTGPLLVFYGPFQNVKRTIVGASMNTLKHQYIARFFLSNSAISKILKTDFSNNTGDDIKVMEFNKSHTDKLEVCNIDGGKFKGKLIIVHDPTRVVVGYSDQIPKSGETTSAIAKRNEAVAAINAGGFVDVQWAGTGGAPMGFLIHNGKVVYNQIGTETTKQDTVAITNKGMLVVGKHTLHQLKKVGVKEAVSFGPALIIDGKGTINSGDGGWGIAPRTVIGQRADGAILFLTIDGRSIKSLGATLRDVQELLLQHKAVNASNLDGGSSTTMYYSGKTINVPSDALGERAVPSVFMVMKD